MELALYDLRHGYYSAHIPPIGARGDFSTSPTRDMRLAERIGRWVKSEAPRDLVEIGAGGGNLTRDLLVRRGGFRIAWLGLLPFRTPRHWIVERSPVLRERQAKLLGRAVRWSASVADVLAATDGRAHLFSNELVDAFPPRVFRRDDDGWRELFLEVKDGALAESWQVPEQLPSSTLFSHEWQAGQRIEVHESYRQWLGSWLPHWSEGRILTIDYGGRPAEIYHRRPSGTIRAYFRQQRFEGGDVYRLPGRQDLTSDVNFEDLMAWGEQFGLRTVAFMNQQEFLAQRPQGRPDESHPLADPLGAGGAFKVLIQEKGVRPGE